MKRFGLVSTTKRRKRRKTPLQTGPTVTIGSVSAKRERCRYESSMIDGTIKERWVRKKNTHLGRINGRGERVIQSVIFGRLFRGMATGISQEENRNIASTGSAAWSEELKLETTGELRSTERPQSLSDPKKHLTKKEKESRFIYLFLTYSLQNNVVLEAVCVH